jgi:hypothetical protein
VYNREEELEIIDSSNFSGKPIFRKMILKVDSASSDKLLHQKSLFLGEAKAIPNRILFNFSWELAGERHPVRGVQLDYVTG